MNEWLSARKKCHSRDQEVTIKAANTPHRRRLLIDVHIMQDVTGKCIKNRSEYEQLDFIFIKHLQETKSTRGNTYFLTKTRSTASLASASVHQSCCSFLTRLFWLMYVVTKGHMAQQHPPEAEDWWKQEGVSNAQQCFAINKHKFITRIFIPATDDL